MTITERWKDPWESCTSTTITFHKTNGWRNTWYYIFPVNFFSIWAMVHHFVTVHHWCHSFTYKIASTVLPLHTLNRFLIPLQLCITFTASLQPLWDSTFQIVFVFFSIKGEHTIDIEVIQVTAPLDSYLGRSKLNVRQKNKRAPSASLLKMRQQAAENYDFDEDVSF